MVNWWMHSLLMNLEDLVSLIKAKIFLITLHRNSTTWGQVLKHQQGIPKTELVNSVCKNRALLNLLPIYNPAFSKSVYCFLIPLSLFLSTRICYSWAGKSDY